MERLSSLAASDVERSALPIVNLAALRSRDAVARLDGCARDSGILVPFFYMGKLDYPVTVMPNCIETGAEPRFAPTTPAGHLQEMVRRTYL
jgi:hypothetical protein